MVDKIKLVPVSGANNYSNVNDNFVKIEKVINENLLSRKTNTGEVNQMENNLDMNNKRIYNLPPPQGPTEPLTAGYIGDLTELVNTAENNISQSNALVVAANAANVEARQILEDTHLALDDALGAINSQTQASLNQINSTSAVILADMTAKQQDVSNKAAAVATQAATVNNQSIQVANDTAIASASASGAAASAATASSAATQASADAVVANSARAQAVAASTAANTSATNAAADAVTASGAAGRAEAAASGIDTAYLLNRANHTGTQAISTVVNLQTSLNAKKNISDNTTIAQGGTGATTAAGARTNLGLGAAAVAAITGIVSQSGGVPTGAIMQRGNNVNGYYHRAADGTQICWQRYNVGGTSITVPALSASLVGSWTYPIAFLNNSDIAVSGSAGFDGGEGFSIRMFAGVNESSVQIQNVTNASKIAAFATTGIYVIAIGRWY